MRTITLIIIYVLLAILVIAVVFSPTIFNGITKKGYTTTYYNVNVTVAKQLINSTANLTIIDCTGGCQPCSWKNGHIANAIWDEFPENYYNYTSDIIVYDNGGLKSEMFCQSLVNHTYGKIYNLVGGYLAWVSGERNWRQI